MDIKELKQSIENKSIKVGFMIFKYSDNDFLPLQYLHEIKNILNTEIQFIDDIKAVLGSSNFFFDDNETDLNVLCCDAFSDDIPNLVNQTNLIIICKKIDKECEQLFKDNIVEFPKLEEWQIKDYVYSIASGVNEKDLDKLINICNKDIYRIDKELKKLKIFNEQERKYVYEKFSYDGIFEDLSEHNIFDFCNAIFKKDVISLSNLYSELNKIDVEPLGLVKLLYDNLKVIIAIQLDPGATAESVGIANNRFWAIKKNNCGYYTKDQLLSMFYIVTDIDRKLKSGLITNDLIIDYLVCHIFSF